MGERFLGTVLAVLIIALTLGVLFMVGIECYNRYLTLESPPVVIKSGECVKVPKLVEVCNER